MIDASGPPAILAEAPLRVTDSVELPAAHGARRLLLRITAPATGKKLPVVILSHGNRLSRADYRPIVDAWARAGFLVIQPDHADAPVDGVRDLPIPRDMWQTRVNDVKRTINALSYLSVTVPGLAGRIDSRKIAVVGHSLGGFTTELIAGARLRDPAAPADLADLRVRSFILLAPPGRVEDLTPEWRQRSPYLNIDFATMRHPLLVVAGEADGGGVMSARDASWRQDAYTLARPGGVCLIVVAGAGHYLGGINGPAMPPVGDDTPARLALVRDVTTRFLRRTLQDNGPVSSGWIAQFSNRPANAGATCK